MAARGSGAEAEAVAQEITAAGGRAIALAADLAREAESRRTLCEVRRLHAYS